MKWSRFLFALPAMAALGAAQARTVTIGAAEKPGSVRLAFGDAAPADTNYLYVAYGPEDGGADTANWTNLAFVATIVPSAASRDVALPEGWGTTVRAVRYFLTEEKKDYLLRYADIRLNGYTKEGTYFLTDYTPDPAKTHVVADLTVDRTGGVRNQAVFCARGSSTSANTFTLFYMPETTDSASNTNGVFRFDCGASINPSNPGEAGRSVKVTMPRGLDLSLEAGPSLRVTPAGGTAAESALSRSSFTPGSQLALFASQTGGTGWDNCLNGRVRSLKIYESDDDTYTEDERVRDYIPVCRHSTGTDALYDTVTRSFLAPDKIGSTAAREAVFEGPRCCSLETVGDSGTFAHVPRTVRTRASDTALTASVSAGRLVTDGLYLALGDVDCGDAISAWPTNVFVADVGPAATNLAVALPAGWGTTYRAARFFLVFEHMGTLNVLEYAQGDGSAYVDLGRKGAFGDIATIEYRFPSGAGTGNLFGSRTSAYENNFAANGGPTAIVADYGNYEASRYGANVDFTVWHRLVLSPTVRCAYRVSDGSYGASQYPHWADTVTESFETPANLWLFHTSGNPPSSKGAAAQIRSLVLQHATGSVTNLLMSLVSVQNADTLEVGFYDRVSGLFLGNAAGKGVLAAGAATGESVLGLERAASDAATRSVSLPMFSSALSVRPAGQGRLAVRLTPATAGAYRLCAAWGAVDGGADPTDWEHLEVVADNWSPAAGDAVWSLPAGGRRAARCVRFFVGETAYVPATSIKGDGTAYIDLGRKGTLGDIAAGEFKYLSGDDGCIFGSRTSATEGNFAFQGDSADVFGDYGSYENSRFQKTNSDFTSYWHKFRLAPEARQVWRYETDGTLSEIDSDTAAPYAKALVTDSFETPENLLLFSMSGNPPVNRGPFTGYVSAFWLGHLDGTVTNLVMHLVPVADAWTHTAGMYDSASSNFFGNAAGSGSFTAIGAVSSTAATRRCIAISPCWPGVGTAILVR